MSKLPTKQELLDQCSGNMIFNKVVAKLMPNKKMARRVVKVEDGFELLDYCDNGAIFSDNGNDYDARKKIIKAPCKAGHIYWAREPARVASLPNEDTSNYMFEVRIKYADGFETTRNILNAFGSKKEMVSNAIEDITIFIEDIFIVETDGREFSDEEIALYAKEITREVLLGISAYLKDNHRMSTPNITKALENDTMS